MPFAGERDCRREGVSPLQLIAEKVLKVMINTNYQNAKPDFLKLIALFIH